MPRTNLSHLLLLACGVAFLSLARAQAELDDDMLNNADVGEEPPMTPEELAMEPMTTEPPACKHVRLPPSLCTDCKLRMHDDMGVFPGDNQRDIYEIDDACRGALDQYANLNTCDVRYGTAIRMLDTLASSRRRVAYFLYSVCEACCDCVPFGARADEYDQRAAAGTLLTVRRGNCPAHFWWDTCRIWPEVRKITGKNGAAISDDLPNVCEPLKVWLDSADGKGWPKNPKVNGLSKPIRSVLSQMMKRGRCSEKQVWQNCANLETAQDRI